MSGIDGSNVKVLVHACVRMESTSPKRVIYVDPYMLTDAPHDADIIFVTHSHGDHFSADDIAKVANGKTVLVSVATCRKLAKNAGFKGDRFVCVSPGQKVVVRGIAAEAVPAYNVGKNFHVKANGWVGYVITLDGERVYVMGDTDVNDDVRKVQTDILCVPIGGKYTMDMFEAAAYVNEVKPALVIPLHYGALGDVRKSADGFADLIDKAINVRIDI